MAMITGCAHAPPATAPIPRLPPITPEMCGPPLPDVYTKLAGEKIASVTLRGVGFDATFMTPTLTTKAGVPFDPDTVRADVRALWKLGLSQVLVTAQPSPEGYAIELAVVPIPRVVRVEISGASRAQLAPLMVLEGTLHDQERLSHLASATQQWLRDHGYARAVLEGESSAVCDGIVVRIDVKLGRRYTLSRIAVTGSVLPAPPALFEHDFGAANVVGGEYHESDFASDLATLVEHHHDAGYSDAKLVPPVVKFDEATGHITADARIDAGVRYKVAIASRGGTPEQRAMIEKVYAPLRDVWLDRDALDRARDRLDISLHGAKFYTEAERANGIYKVTIVIKDAT